MNCTPPRISIYTRCPDPAAEYLIYGCLDQHITETALCADHAMKWLYVQHNYKHTCHCKKLIEDYISIRMHK